MCSVCWWNTKPWKSKWFLSAVLKRGHRRLFYWPTQDLYFLYRKKITRCKQNSSSSSFLSSSPSFSSSSPLKRALNWHISCFHTMYRLHLCTLLVKAYNESQLSCLSTYLPSMPLRTHNKYSTKMNRIGVRLN